MNDCDYASDLASPPNEPTPSPAAIRALERLALDIEFAAQLDGLTRAQRDRLRVAANLIRHKAK